VSFAGIETFFKINAASVTAPKSVIKNVGIKNL
jgi:hypothetical protein